MADSKLQDLNSGTGVVTLVDANFFYSEQGTTAKFCLASVIKTYVSASPTLVTPNIGTPSAGVMTNLTGTLTSPTFVTPVLGTPSSGDISACTSTSLTMVTPILGTVTSGDISACLSTSMVMVTPILGTVTSGEISACTGTPVELAAMIAGNTVGVTGTVGGGTTGLIPATAEHVTVTSTNADHQISLPAAIAGKRIRISQTGANAIELISVVAGDKVNTVVVGATNEAALVVGSLYTLEYDGTDNWIMTGTDALGAVETPVVPNSL